MSEDAADEPPVPAPQMRTFSLNSPEAYEFLCGGQEHEPWIRNGALPRAPRSWNLPVLREG